MMSMIDALFITYGTLTFILVFGCIRFLIWLDKRHPNNETK